LREKAATNEIQINLDQKKQHLFDPQNDKL